MISITVDLASQLIAEQFPEYADLPIQSVDCGGIDNRTFHLGDALLIRMPSAAGYAPQVEKEQKWLPYLAPHLSMAIPTPIAQGQPNKDYPWHWSIVRWIFGQSVNQIKLSDRQLEQLAQDLAQFLKELHRVPTKDAPAGGLHNYYRGCHPSAYDTEARADITRLCDIIDSPRALAVWEAAMRSQWQSEPVWVHGDVASGNILVHDMKMTAMIDFGCMAVGDPACDLVIAWTLFEGKARKLFKDSIDLDADTWARARGWALWKAQFELVACKDQDSAMALDKLRIIHAVLEESP